MNFLEQLTKEWFEYQDYFVRTNVKFGRLGHGGWKGEMDVVVIDPSTSHLTHVEVSSDADTWAVRRQRLGDKFEKAKPHYREVFPSTKGTARCVAIVGTSSNSRESLGLPGIKEISIPEFVAEITAYLAEKAPLSSAVPEHWPLIRAMQFACAWGRLQG